MTTMIPPQAIDDRGSRAVDAPGATRAATPSMGSQHRLVSFKDITMVFGVRLHAENPWLAERLRAMAEYYDPCPKIVIVDFGSDTEHAKVVEDICADNGYTYHFVPDFDVFSLASARNAAFEQTSTDFVFFCDPDFVGERDLFDLLAKNATALNMRDVIDIVLNLPAFHLDSDATQTFEQLPNPTDRSFFLRQLTFKLSYSEMDNEKGRFGAPYSNIFLINRKMFSLVGGYDNNFRGHGSEDFEFLLRLCAHSNHLPMPRDPQSDVYGPLRDEFFVARPYVGFRRLFELMAQPSEGLGLKVFHLHHPRATEGSWYKNRDSRRNNFRAATDLFLSKHHQLLAVDHLSRATKVACLCLNVDTWGYFVPLRLAGYETVPVFDDNPETLAAVTEALKNGSISDVAIFNPYMKSHASFRPLVMLARELGRNVIVLERGALPSTIYYDDDVCYNSPNFSAEAFRAEVFTEDELTQADEYIAGIRRGTETLEDMNSYEETSRKFIALKSLKATKCFIPLQLDDDMSVTMFIKGEQRYSNFVASIPKLIERHPEIIFVIKPHPLSKIDGIQTGANVVIADRRDNIHYLLDIADVTLCYNSGVGLLALLHETPLVTLGNAFYNIEGVGYRATSADEGLTQFLAGNVPAPDEELVRRLTAWFLLRRYSRFIATDDIRDFQTRRAHGYSEILITRFRWRSHDYQLGRIKETAPFSWRSYAAARIGPDAKVSGSPRDAGTLKRWGLKDFHEGKYAKAALHLTESHRLKSQPNLLRFAAEAHYRAGKRADAIEAQRKAVNLQPHGKRAKLRLLVMKYPILGKVIGTWEVPVPPH